MDNLNIENFKNATSLTKWIKTLLYIEIGFGFIDVYEYYYGVFLSTQISFFDYYHGALLTIQILIFLILTIQVLIWIYRANHNVRCLGATDMRFTPEWSISWYFVPIANFWKPYQAMKEIWKASKDPQNWQQQEVSSIIPWWWFLWIVVNFLIPISWELFPAIEVLNTIEILNIVLIIPFILSISLNVIFLLMVKNIYKMQMSHYERLKRNFPAMD